jgi:type I restriction enzyme R subunit
MAEYLNVEKPFLAKLQELGWQVIEQGSGIPQDPTISLRSSFRQVTLEQVFKDSIRKINLHEGKPWLTEQQLRDVFANVSATEYGGLSLLEANQQVFKKLVGIEKISVDINELTGEKDPLVKIVDFINWSANSFIAINQFRVVTPGGPREGIIPDITLFVNGLPFVVIECKDVGVTNPLSESINQISRYANTRDDIFETKEGEEKLFHYNLFSIATHGEEARSGTITGDFEFYLNWKDIFPEKYKTINITEYTKEETERYKGNRLQLKPDVRQEVLIHGMLNKEILLDVLQHFTLFKEMKEGTIAKIIARYQQYRAVGKIINKVRVGETSGDKSGVIWHTQGSGKSLTMVFLVRKLRSLRDLKDLKAIMIVDRSDLETQLSKDAKLTGEFKDEDVVKNRKELSKKLSGDASNLSMVMIHKFFEAETKEAKSLKAAFKSGTEVPKFKPFKVVNSSDRIIMLIDEAHRTQGGDMGDNLFLAFPNAIKIAFTGTPLLTARHKQKTHERFGTSSEFIDTYKIRQAVDDRATLDIVYIGKTSKDNIKDREAFDRSFEDVFKMQTVEAKEEIQKRYGTMQAYLENIDRLTKIANDIVDHYINEILPNGYKAMVVASSILAAARYEFLILKAIKERLMLEEAKEDKDDELIEQIKMLEACTVVTKQDNNEEGYISAVRKKAKEMKAVRNFKKDFDYAKDSSGNFLKPETGIGILCVCDRLLTGFDAPIAQVMYLDKSLREHDLLQAVARVNRTKSTKEHGILVDYYGVSNNLVEALNIYGSEEEEDIKELLAYFRDLNKEIPVLEARYNRLIHLFVDRGIIRFEDFLNQVIADNIEEVQLVEDCIMLAEDLAFRAQFDTYFKAYFDSLDLLFNTRVAKQYYIPSKRLGYLLVRIRNRYKDATLDLKWAKPKIRKLIDQYLETLGIDSKIPPVNLLSDDFPSEVNKLGQLAQSKASEMEHALRRHIKVNLEKDPAMYQRFLERMNQIMERYKGNWQNMVDAFTQLREDIKEGRKKDTEEGLTEQELPFFDLLIMLGYKEGTVVDASEKIRLKATTIEIVKTLKSTVNLPDFWKTRDAEVRKLRGVIDDIIDFCGVESIEEQRQFLTREVMDLAKKRHSDLIKEV